MEEKWKLISGFKDYKISQTGKLMRATAGNTNCTKVGKMLSIKPNSRGYVVVSLFRDGSRNIKGVHRLVGIAFIPNPENKPEINHKDGDKANNNVNNLEWVTRKENVNHAESVLNIYKPHGEKHGNSKFKNKDIKKIRQMHPNYSMQKIADIHNVHATTIWAIINRITWKHISVYTTT